MTSKTLSAAPPPTRISPELLRQHGLTAEEYGRIEQALGRTPSLTELGIYSVMWSEHCSYKSSRVHLKRLPTRSERVVQGPGENAGIIDIGEGWACAFKIESHNHPSYIEPFQGATTGVGGILRDIFTMGARPLAVMDSLRFGPLTAEGSDSERALLHKNHSILEGVVSGVASYGNCFGVPNLGGETRFEPCYSGNPLVNAFALGLVRKDEIFYAKATGVGNPVIYVGAKTGRDGIHGATMASEEFTEDSDQKRPNVQMGDPFMEKLLLEACIEAMQTGAVVGIQDMGAAGLTCSTCEMGARGGVGLEVELDHVPQRETGMSSYDIMLSESQERMLLVAEKGREDEVLEVFSKWGLDGVIVGEVIAEPRLRITHHGELVCDIPNQSLTDDAPLYHRPVGTWKAPVPLDPPADVLKKLKAPRDYTADLKTLLASANICSKRWVFEQYDSMVQTNTVQGPGGEAGVMRVKGTQIGLAMALDGNSRWCYLDPKQGAKLAVAEAARKVACTGAVPVAATNCLNFGNPEKPEIMAQLSEAIDGIAEACTALGTPITGGNVSLYNETRGEGIYPTPVIGIVGLLDDVAKAVPADFQREGDAVMLIASSTGTNAVEAFGSSEYAKTVLGTLWGTPPPLDLTREAELHKCVAALASEKLLHSARGITDGGVAVAAAETSFRHGIGASFLLRTDASVYSLFGEEAGDVLATCDPSDFELVQQIADQYGFVTVVPLGTTGGARLQITAADHTLIDEDVAVLRSSWSGALQSALGGRCGDGMSGLMYQGVPGMPDTNTSHIEAVVMCNDSSDKFKDECGVAAIYPHPEAARQIYLMLYALQHRGQESAGIATADGTHLSNIKGMGLVAEIFTDEVLQKLPGTMAIGHTRYSTTGDSALLNAQPIRVESTKGLIAIAHNGNLVNLGNIRTKLERSGAFFQTTSDSEIIVQLIAHSRATTLVDAIADSLSQVEGAFSIVMMTRDRIFAARDPRGFRPLSMGRIRNESGPDTIVFASETCAFDLLRAEYVRDVEPGELVMVTEEGVTSRRYSSGVPQTSCIFEHVYFARPDSRIYGRWVQQSREAMGRHLARESGVPGDLVVPVPDSGVTAAIGYAAESGIPFNFGLIRNHYVGRTFIEPEQRVRDFGVKLKLNPVRSLLQGKRIILIDDSIIRGTTSRKIVRMVRAAGATEVHLRISCPPTTSPCFYGVDTPSKKDLIAANNTIEEIRQFIEADSLAYLSMDGLLASCDGGEQNGFCVACYTGVYPTQLVQVEEILPALAAR